VTVLLLIYGVSFTLLVFDQFMQWDTPRRDAVLGAVIVTVFAPVLALIWVAEMVYRLLSNLMERILR
jgi:hypothetical protein